MILVGLIAVFGSAAPAFAQSTNIAPSGTAYRWYNNSSATSNSNRVAASGLNDGDLTTDVNLHGTGGETSKNRYEAGGVVWSAPQTISSVSFINGAWISTGDGSFAANLSLQFTTDGTTWTDSGWTVSPSYPYDSSAANQMYNFTGTPASVRGVRVSGQLHIPNAAPWYANLREVQAFGSGGGGGLPDVIVTSVTASPANPTVGQAVTFSAVVKNQGTGATPAGTTIGVSFSVDGTEVSWSDTDSTSLPAGASVTLTANGGPTSGTWSATAGTHTILAYVDDINRFAESNESNNTLSTSITVGTDSVPPTDPTNLSASAVSSSQINLSWTASTDNVGVTGYRVYRNGTQVGTPSGTSYSDTGLSASTAYTYTVSAYDAAGNNSAQSNTASATTQASGGGTNPALNRLATASSLESSSFPASNAFDGNTSTRWASLEGIDPQWIYVDLGATYDISRVKLTWEAAYGAAYQIQVSSNATNWTTIYSTTSGNGDVDDLTGLSGTGRYVRMYGTARGCTCGSLWGYSLYEFEVYGTQATGGDTTPPSDPTNLTASAVSSSQINLSWTASTDNVGVTGYRVYRNGTQVGTPSGTSYSDTGLSASTAYSYYVRAVDAAGNISLNSNTASATTQAAAGLPDVIVTSVTASPANPTVGQAVTFSAVVKNQGTGATPAGTTIGVSFSVDGTEVSWSDTDSTSLPAGASVTLTANGGPTSGTWSATAGTHTILAYVDDIDRFAESNESNNTLSTSITVGSASDTTPPTVSITAPTNGASITYGTTVTIIASASDNVGVTSVDFKVDGTTIYTDTTSPYSTNWSGFGLGAHTLTAVAHDAAGNTKTSSGVTVTAVSGSTSLQLGMFNGNVGTIQATFAGWNDTPPCFSGQTTFIYWENPNVSLDSIISGAQDSVITNFGNRACANTIIAPFHEMNGNWDTWDGTVGSNTPAKVVAAWKHIHDIIGNKVRYAWVINNSDVPSRTGNRPSDYWPGDAYVDIIGMDGFDWGGLSFLQAISPNFNVVKGWNYGKPLWITSFGTPTGSSQAAWVTDAINQAPGQGISALIYFNYYDPDIDFRLNAAALAAYHL